VPPSDEKPPENALEARRKAEREEVRRRLTGSPCSCDQCEREDAEVRDREIDRWAPFA
jgi:hypothetical protein